MAPDEHLAFKSSSTLMACDVPLLRSSPSLGEVLHENQSNLCFDPQLLGSWVVINIISGVAGKGSPYMHVWPQRNDL